MSIKKLEKEIQSRLTATSNVNNYKKAIEELVYNSLDSGSTSIAIRIDVPKSFIQVIDNGSGIDKSDFRLLGQRYTTSKTDDGNLLQNGSDKYGYRGESLANIIEVSNNVKITSRCEKNNETWIKYFCKGQHRDSYLTTMRPSKGTTVEIQGFLYNLHIQKKETKSVIEIQNIKTFLEQISLERTNISISFRDNSRNEIIFTVHKNRDVYQTLLSLFEIDKVDIQELQVEKNQYKIKGYVGKTKADHHWYKWIYLNGRFIQKSVLHDIVAENFIKSKTLFNNRKLKSNLYDNEENTAEIPYYFIFISCPRLDYDIYFNSERTIVQFKDWNQIKLLIEKFVKFYNGEIKLKEIEIKQRNVRKAVENTQEEARKIVEKILGNKTKIAMISQMDKGVKGKTARKKVKKKIMNDSTQKKSYCKKNNKCYKTKETSLIDALSPIRDDHLCNILEDNKTKTCYKNRLNGRLEGKIKRDILKFNVDPVIKKFDQATDSVRKRCDLHSENVKELLIKKCIPLPEYKRYTNVYTHEKNANNMIPYKRVKYTVIHNDPKVTIEKSNHVLNPCVMPLTNANKEYLRSYDLVKTVLNSQKDYSCMIDVVSQQNTDNSSIGNEKYYNSNKNFIRVTNCEFNAASSLTKLTFDSHSYQKHNNYNTKNTNQLYVSLRNEITQSASVAKFNDGTLRKHLIYKSKGEKEQQRFDNVDLTKLDKAVQYNGYQESYNISFSNINGNNKSIVGIDNKLNYDRPNYNVTRNIQSTYTIVDSNLSINIRNYINNETHMEDVYQKSIKLKEKYNFNIPDQQNNSYNHSNELFSSEYNRSNSKLIFSSYSKDIESQNISNSCFEPLSVCEAVYENHAMNNRQVINTRLSETGRGSKENCSNTSSNLKIDNESGDNKSEVINEMDDISHHLVNANILDLHSNINQVNDKNEDQALPEKEFNSKVNDTKEICTFESLDICLETIADLMETVDRYQASNNFKIQNRYNFIPKGMSPIFENCNSKKICFHDLEMDYFQEDLYNQFANKVLDNFNLFETEIQNVNDNVSNFSNFNSKLEKDNNNLKFNTHSLKNAKVHGQIDNKYIVAELHSETNHTLKHLVLFDQHAVHERIKLEEYLSDYKEGDLWISVDCETFSIKLSKENVIYLNNFKDKFTQLGLKWSFENGLVLINAIPKAILGNHCRQPDVVLRCIKKLITEEISAIKCLRGNSLLCPKSIMDLIFSEACRYAIKFGDALCKNQCAMLIESLSSCKTPFQCAHGRPVMAVLLDIKPIINQYTADLCKISIFRNKLLQ